MLQEIESVVHMDKQTLAIASALGDKKAGKLRSKITRQAMKHLNETK